MRLSIFLKEKEEWERARNSMKLIIIGIQGSGKSTQGKLLARKLNISYLSAGHIFRDLARERSRIGRYVKEHLHAGMLLPDKYVLQIVHDYLSKPEYARGYILDGFPRTEKQAERFQDTIDHVIYLDVSDREALWRLSLREEDGKEDRDDETLAAVRHRIELFHKHTKPVLDFYREKRKLLEINGEQSIEKIHHAILAKLRQ